MARNINNDLVVANKEAKMDFSSNKHEITIIVAGDLCPTDNDMDAFCSGDPDKLLDEELIALFNNADYRICNLETVLTSSTKPISKSGPALSAKTEAVNVLKSLGINYVSLANNHIMDFGEKGATDTISVLNTNSISYSGIGNNIAESSKVFFVTISGVKIGILSCAEHEFSIATENSYGAYGFDPLETPDIITSSKQQCDYLIVLYHGGKEYYRYPSPNLRKVCMKCVEKGADLVVCQHSHCIGAIQKYMNSEIVYGQGNFVFNRRSDEFWDTGLLLRVNIDVDSHETSIDYMPIQSSGIKRIVPPEEKSREILDALYKRSQEAEEPELLQDLYESYALRNLDIYTKKFLGKSISSYGFRALKKIFGAKRSFNHFFGKQETMELLNIIECEAHRELMLSGLKAISNQSEE